MFSKAMFRNSPISKRMCSVISEANKAALFIEGMSQALYNNLGWWTPQTNHYIAQASFANIIDSALQTNKPATHIRW